MKHKNKYAYGDFDYDFNQVFNNEEVPLKREKSEPLEANVLVAYNENIIPEETNGAWFKPYVTMEKVDLDNGPKVDNTA